METRNQVKTKENSSLIKNSSGVTILESDSIKSILDVSNKDSFVVLDLDNTVIESTEHLGSDQWFVQMMKEACQMEPSPEMIQFVLAVYHAVQHHIELKTVEDHVKAVIEFLHDAKIPVIALTARGNNIAKPTVAQLKKNGIAFNDKWDKHSGELTTIRNTPVVYENGIIFCSGNNKGACLKAFFEKIKHQPSHVVMVDDKEKHLHIVGETLQNLDIKFSGIRYSFLDDKIKLIDMEHADKSIVKMSDKFSDAEKHALMRVRPKTKSAIIKSVEFKGPGESLKLSFFAEKKNSINQEKPKEQKSFKVSNHY